MAAKPLPLYKIDLLDDDVYQFTCENGHTTTSRLHEARCEMLFQVAINAVADGYFREAVVSGTASMERFFELFVRSALIHLKVPKEQRDESWKQMSKQSERQLGAFIAMYATLFKKPPALLSNKDSQFRNEVVHKGYLPTRAEAVGYLNTLLGLMNPMVLEMRGAMAEAVDEWHRETKAAQPSKEWNSSISFNTVFRVTYDKTDRDLTIDAALEIIEATRARRLR